MKNILIVTAIVALVACSAFPEPTSQQAPAADAAQSIADSTAPSDTGAVADQDAGSSGVDSAGDSDVLNDTMMADAAQQDTAAPDAPITDAGQTTPEDTQSSSADAADTWDPLAGYYPTSCGAPNQGLTPVDCTAKGDSKAMCVFSNHCMCSDGFECETPSTLGKECKPGDICVPES